MHICVSVLVEGNILVMTSSLDSNVGSSSKSSFKFAAVNFETELVENNDDGMLIQSVGLTPHLYFIYLVTLLSDVSHVIQHEKDADTVLLCQGSKMEEYSINKF
jgi:hypothetical protein